MIRISCVIITEGRRCDLNRIYQDMSGIIILILFSLLIWSSVTTEQSSMIVLALMLLFLFLANLYFILTRQGANIIERTIYTFLFFIATSIVFSVLLADDFNNYVVFIFLLSQMLVLGILGTILSKEYLINKYSRKQQDFVLFTVSVVLVIINLLLISNM